MTDPRAECACGNRLYPPATQCDECVFYHRAAINQQCTQQALQAAEDYATHIQSTTPADIDPGRLSHAVEALDIITEIRRHKHPPRELADRLKKSATAHYKTGSAYLSVSMEMLAEKLSPEL